MALVESPRARRDQYLSNGLPGSPRRSTRSRSRSPQVSAGKARAPTVPHTNSRDSLNADQQRAGSPCSAPAGPEEHAAGNAPVLPSVSTRTGSPELVSAFAMQQQPFSQDGEEGDGAAGGGGHKRAHSESPSHRRQQQRIEDAQEPSEAAAAATTGARQSPFLSSAFACPTVQMPSPANGAAQQPSFSSQAGPAAALQPLKVPPQQLLPEQLLTEADIQQAVSLQGWLPELAGSPSMRGSPLEVQGSLRHWARNENSLSSSGSFSLQQQQVHGTPRSAAGSRLGRNDSLELDIRVLPPVLPEQYPEGALEEQEQMLLELQRRREEEEEEEALLEQHEREAEEQEAAEAAAAETAEAAEAAAGAQQPGGSSHSAQPPGSSFERPCVRPPAGKSRLAVSSSGGVAEGEGGAGPSGSGDQAFFAKIAAWEQELVGMLQAQDTPVSIRAIIATFKDRILTERDKTEFKGLCDKWTSVVEWPAGTKCLQMKGWMRGAKLQA